MLVICADCVAFQRALVISIVVVGEDVLSHLVIYGSCK